MLANNTAVPSTSFFQSDLWLFSIYIIGAYEITFWLCNSLLIFIEMFDIPSIDQYRIQKQKKKLRFQPDMVRLMINETIVNQISTAFFIPVVYFIFKYFDGLDLHGVRPSWTTIAFQLALFILSEDTIFFWSHYFLHTPWLYQKIHKKHHVYKQPTGVTAVLSDPIESITNQVAFWFMPIFLRGTHIFTLCAWVMIRIYQTILAHSGYNFPYISTQYWLPELMPGALAHDFHHQHGKWNYGSFFSVWDQLMGTHRLSSSTKQSN